MATPGCPRSGADAEVAKGATPRAEVSPEALGKPCSTKGPQKADPSERTELPVLSEIVQDCSALSLILLFGDEAAGSKRFKLG